MLRHAWALLAPPLCGVCGDPADAGAPLCARCAAALSLARPAGFTVLAADWALAASAYDGIPRDMVSALKFRERLPLAAPMAAAMAAAAGDRLRDAVLVPVPPAPARRRRRGFDPADEIARALARHTRLPLLRCLGRADGPRQVGRARHQRLGSPPEVVATRDVPGRAVLIDDVTTTGATLGACAIALRAAGSTGVAAVAFAHTK